MLFMRLDATEKAALRAWFLRHPNFERGTLCSGTDGPGLVFDAFVDAAHEVLHISLTMTHNFSCEAKPDKRQFIQKFCNPPFICGGGCFLAEQDASAYDYKTGGVVSAPSVSNATFGFPCQDGSSQNTNRQQYNDVVATAGGRTGFVCHQCLQHINEPEGPHVWFGRERDGPYPPPL